MVTKYSKFNLLPAALVQTKRPKEVFNLSQHTHTQTHTNTHRDRKYNKLDKRAVLLAGQQNISLVQLVSRATKTATELGRWMARGGSTVLLSFLYLHLYLFLYLSRLLCVCVK